MTERPHFHFSFHALEKEMATHFSVLAWRIPGKMGEPGGLQSMGSHRVGHDLHDLASTAAMFLCNILKCVCINWKKKWQPTPVFLPGKSHGWRSLAGYSPWDHKESDMTEWITLHNILKHVCIRSFVCSSILDIISLWFLLSSPLNDSIRDLSVS